jgi:mRNA interferase RelE/StbE
MYRVFFHKYAENYYRKQNQKVRARLDKAFEYLKSNPYRGTNIKRLTGELSHLYRYRIGNLRILYEIHETSKIVRVKNIGPRGDIY